MLPLQISNSFLSQLLSGAGQQPALQTEFSQQSTNENVQQTGAEQKTFTPAQQGLQGQSLGFISSLLGGSLPQAFSSFVFPQEIRDAAFQDFNRYRAPQLAAIHGAGTPVINAALQDLQLRLAAQAAERAQGVVPQAVNAFEAAARFAFTPTGATAQDTRTSQQDVTKTGVRSSLEELTEFGFELGKALGIFPPAPPPFNNI